MEPAAVLVAPFEVEIGGELERTIPLQHRGETDAGVEPDVEDIFLLGPVERGAVSTPFVGRQKVFARFTKPIITTTFFELISDVIDRLLVQ